MLESPFKMFEHICTDDNCINHRDIQAWQVNVQMKQAENEQINKFMNKCYSQMLPYRLSLSQNTGIRNKDTLMEAS